jgi:asparagine synthase (glutamine-hydrolysing)
MCGIFAAVNLESSFGRKENDLFISLSDLVKYRGPDNSGYLTFNSCKKEVNPDNFNVFLGHRRLSIIDLSEQGNQPLFKDGIYIIFNGEIFNYLELKNEYFMGESFRTKTDTEVIIKIYQKFGPDGFQYLNGMWSFILFDTINNKLIISRDRFSIKPLFTYSLDNCIYFASEIKQLLPLLKSKDINNDVMFKYLKQGLVDYDNNSFWEGISKLPPKENMIIDLLSKKIVHIPYWDYSINDIKNENNALEEFRSIFIDSIKIRLRSDVNIGALLSGGLDSSAISVLADNLAEKKFETYSVISHDKKYSEEKFIDILAGQKNISNHKLFLEPAQILAHMDEVIGHQDEPFGSFSIIAQYLIFQLIKENSDIKVVLSGQGGDELLMGYLKYFFFYLKQLIKKNEYITLSREVLSSLLNRTVLTQFKFNLGKRYIRSNQQSNLPFLLVDYDLEKIWDVSTIRSRQIKDIDHYSVPNLNRYEDRNSMAHSIESRTPFLDHRMVNFCLSLGEQYKIKNGWTKYILRKSISELPRQISWRRDKRNFLIPENYWIRSELKNKIKDEFRNSVLHQKGIIDKNLFMKYYDSFINGNPAIHYTDISRVYIAELWAKKYH